MTEPIKTSVCPGFGKHWDVDIPECKLCSRHFIDDYRECRRLTLEKAGKKTKTPRAKSKTSSIQRSPRPRASSVRKTSMPKGVRTREYRREVLADLLLTGKTFTREIFCNILMKGLHKTSVQRRSIMILIGRVLPLLEHLNVLDVDKDGNFRLCDEILKRNKK